MKSRTFVTVLVAILVMFVVVQWLAPDRGEAGKDGDRPWDIEVLGDGHSRVFGITLGRSTLSDARLSVRARPEIAVFDDGDGALSAEAFFKEVTVGGLSGKLYARLDVPPARLQAIAENAAATQKAESGTRKITPAASDRAALQTVPIQGLTFLPYADLSDTVIIDRFGEPDERIETATGQYHMLYPGKGLDIVFHEQGKEVLQYVAPRDFHRLRSPLREDVGA